MRVLFDQGTPVPLRRFLTGHQVATARELGWSSVTNGALLDAAEGQGFEVLVTKSARQAEDDRKNARGRTPRQ